MSALSVIGPIEQVGTMILNGPMRFFGLVRSGINSKWAKDFLVQLPGWDSIVPYPREKKKESPTADHQTISTVQMAESSSQVEFQPHDRQSKLGGDKRDDNLHVSEIQVMTLGWWGDFFFLPVRWCLTGQTGPVNRSKPPSAFAGVPGGGSWRGAAAGVLEREREVAGIGALSRLNGSRPYQEDDGSSPGERKNQREGERERHGEVPVALESYLPVAHLKTPTHRLLPRRLRPRITDLLLRLLHTTVRRNGRNR